MINRKFGLNAYNIYVVKKWSHDEPKLKCAWLGHTRFKCAHCKLGYFNVYTENRYDEECPECKYEVVLRWSGSE